MPRITIDLAGVGTGPQLIEPGEYPVRLVSAEEAQSQGGHPMIVWEWEITAGESAGLVYRSYSSLQPQALFNLKNVIEALGEDASGEIDLDTDVLLGRKARMVLSVQNIRSRNTGEDIKVNRVERILPAANGKAPATSSAPTKKPPTGGRNIPF